LLGISASDGGVVSTHILLMGLLLLAGMAAIIALMRNGVRTFWASDAVPARLQLTEFLPIAILLGLCLLLTILAQPVMSYMDRASASLHQPDLYIERVMTAPVVPGVVHATEAISGGETP
jgi:multicomponent K+:H+ antiporter subunit D